MPALVGIAPLAELPHAGVQHLVGMEARVLAIAPAPAWRSVPAPNDQA
jgi:hypothetical protein